MGIEFNFKGFWNVFLCDGKGKYDLNRCKVLGGFGF